MNQAPIQQRESSLGHLLQSLLYTICTVLIFGLIYPLIVTVLAHVLFPQQADGSLIRNTQGNVIGSALTGQIFTQPGYFHPRPSAAGNGYDPMQSSGTNLGPTSKKLIDTTRATIIALKKENAQPQAMPPNDLISSSASGLDPDISPEAAEYQAARIAHARHVSQATVESLIARYTVERDFGILGEPRVNVLNINLALDQIKM